MKRIHSAPDKFGPQGRRPAATFLRADGFTLVEVVIALTIVIVIAAAAMPTFRGFQDENLAREPIQELVRMAKEARLRAMKEKRPYQIAFYADGFSASRYFNPYIQLSELQDYLTNADQIAQEAAIRSADDRTPDEDNGAAATSPSGETEIPGNSAAGSQQAADEWTAEYKLPAGTTYTIQFWHELEPVPVEGELVKLWVFQPSGICQPLKLQLDRPSASFEIEFGALTADIVHEVSNLK